MISLNSLSTNFKKIFFTPIHTLGQWGIAGTVALCFIMMPQRQPIDWDLNTSDFWSSFPDIYANPDHVYPPWGLILMLPYLWMGAAGARVLSVMVLAWLCKQQGWSLSRFLSIVLSPFFLVTMTKSNLDIFVILLPILLWRAADGKNWQTIGWGAALALSMLKPQGMVFIWVYWLWQCRHRLKELLLPTAIVAIITIPISLVNKPVLLWQWYQNLAHPSAQNLYFWSINNLSLTSHLGAFKGLAVVLGAAALIAALVKFRLVKWSENHLIASLIFLSFFIMPYSSQQSFSSAYGLIPSWWASVLQFVIIKTSNYLTDYVYYMPWFVFVFALISLVLFTPQTKASEQVN